MKWQTFTDNLPGRRFSEIFWGIIWVTSKFATLGPLLLKETFFTTFMVLFVLSMCPAQPLAIRFSVKSHLEVMDFLLPNSCEETRVEEEREKNYQFAQGLSLQLRKAICILPSHSKEQPIWNYSIPPPISYEIGQPER